LRQGINMSQEWIDISVPLRSGMVHWPGDPPIVIDPLLDMRKGDACNVSMITFGSHTGTHMDAPFHYNSRGASIDQMPLAATVGRAKVIEIKDPKVIQPQEIKDIPLNPGDRILFKTKNSNRCWKTDSFVEDYVYLDFETAKLLAQRKVQTVGVDYLSVGGFKVNGVETHRALLDAGIWIIEGLNLSGVEPGEYELLCLPLRIEGGDGAPARALLRHL